MSCAFLMLMGLFSHYKSPNKLPWFTKVLKCVVNLKYMNPFVPTILHLPLQLDICFRNCSLKASKRRFWDTFIPSCARYHNCDSRYLTFLQSSQHPGGRNLASISQQNPGLIFICLPAFTVWGNLAFTDHWPEFICLKWAQILAVI